MKIRSLIFIATIFAFLASSSAHAKLRYGPDMGAGYWESYEYGMNSVPSNNVQYNQGNIQYAPQYAPADNVQYVQGNGQYPPNRVEYFPSRQEVPASKAWQGDISRFQERDADVWQNGRWFRGVHDGRDGYWWVVNGIWYYYPSPVYPYPDPYTPSTAASNNLGSVPATARFWYCPNPAGYYPYVPRCNAPWQNLTATVAEPVPAPAAQVPQTLAYPQQQVQAPQQQVQVLSSPQRDADYSQLNDFSTEFSKINLNARGARTKIESLEKRIAEFRRTLLDRNYNSIGILKDTEDLSARIEREKAKVRRR